MGPTYITQDDAIKGLERLAALPDLIRPSDCSAGTGTGVFSWLHPGLFWGLLVTSSTSNPSLWNYIKVARIWLANKSSDSLLTENHWSYYFYRWPSHVPFVWMETGLQQIEPINTKPQSPLTKAHCAHLWMCCTSSCWAWLLSHHACSCQWPTQTGGIFRCQ